MGGFEYTDSRDEMGRFEYTDSRDEIEELVEEELSCNERLLTLQLPSDTNEHGFTTSFSYLSYSLKRSL
jgi:hypothetical protein